MRLTCANRQHSIEQQNALTRPAFEIAMIRAGERELEAFENTKLFTALNEEDKASINDLVASIKEKAKEKVMNTYEKEVRETG